MTDPRATVAYCLCRDCTSLAEGGELFCGTCLDHCCFPGRDHCQAPGTYGPPGECALCDEVGEVTGPNGAWEACPVCRGAHKNAPE